MSIRRILRPSLSALAMVAAAAGVAWSRSAPPDRTQSAVAQDCPSSPPVTLSATVPADVCIPSGFSGNPIQFFDDFSWRSFVALVWPAMQGQRGVPNPALSVGTSGQPLVFETYKMDWEVFQPGGAAPSAFSSYAGQNPCGTGVSPQFGDLVLASFSKYDDLGQAGFGNLVGPLVAQNGTYVRYLTAFNATEFAPILNRRLYLRANLGTAAQPLTLPDGSIDVKSAWMLMTGVAHPERYYTRQAYVMDLPSGTCSLQTVGLVGLHIVQKTPSRPQWIWSTFEQVDNIPQDHAQAPFGFNDGGGTVMPPSNPISFPPPNVPPDTFNVERIKPIASSTQQTTAAYQQALASQGTGVWQFYQLTMTQWPLQANQPNLPGTPGNTFPGSIDASTAFSNVVLETFDQSNVRTGCMNCHTQSKAASDFLWSLSVNAFPRSTTTPEINRLRTILNASRNTP